MTEVCNLPPDIKYLFELDHKAVKLLLIGQKLRKIEQKLIADLTPERQQ